MCQDWVMTVMQVNEFSERIEAIHCSLSKKRAHLSDERSARNAISVYALISVLDVQVHLRSYIHRGRNVVHHPRINQPVVHAQN